MLLSHQVSRLARSTIGIVQRGCSLWICTVRVEWQGRGSPWGSTRGWHICHVTVWVGLLHLCVPDVDTVLAGVLSMLYSRLYWGRCYQGVRLCRATSVELRQPVACDVPSLPVRWRVGPLLACASLALCKEAGGNVVSMPCSHAVLVMGGSRTIVVAELVPGGSFGHRAAVLVTTTLQAMVRPHTSQYDYLEYEKFFQSGGGLNTSWQLERLDKTTRRLSVVCCPWLCSGLGPRLPESGNHISGRTYTD
jgi:hypothetical protein